MLIVIRIKPHTLSISFAHTPLTLTLPSWIYTLRIIVYITLLFTYTRRRTLQCGWVQAGTLYRMDNRYARMNEKRVQWSANIIRTIQSSDNFGFWYRDFHDYLYCLNIFNLNCRSPESNEIQIYRKGGSPDSHLARIITSAAIQASVRIHRVSGSTRCHAHVHRTQMNWLPDVMFFGVTVSSTRITALCLTAVRTTVVEQGMTWHHQIFVCLDMWEVRCGYGNQGKARHLSVKTTEEWSNSTGIWIQTANQIWIHIKILDSNFRDRVQLNFVSSHMYPENLEGIRIIAGSMNMGYVSETARTQTRNLLHPKCAPIPLGHGDGFSFSFSTPWSIDPQLISHQN